MIKDRPDRAPRLSPLSEFFSQQRHSPFELLERVVEHAHNVLSLSRPSHVYIRRLRVFGLFTDNRELPCPVGTQMADPKPPSGSATLVSGRSERRWLQRYTLIHTPCAAVGFCFRIAFSKNRFTRFRAIALIVARPAPYGVLPVIVGRQAWRLSPPARRRWTIRRILTNPEPNGTGLLIHAHATRKMP